MVPKEGDDSIDFLLWDGLLFEDTFECVFEPRCGESFEDSIDSFGELLQIAPMEVGRNPVEIRTGSKHHQITRIRLATAMEFHRKQQFSLRNPRCYRTASSEFLSDGMLCQVAERPLRPRLSTTQHINHHIKSDWITEVFLKPDSAAFMTSSPA